MLNSNQIKLADGSNTTFDAASPDIRYQFGGDLSEVKGFKAFTPENIQEVLKSMDLINLAEQHHTGLNVITGQFTKGLEVEKEHTDNLLLAAEIVKDHIAESKEYYTLLEEMENKFEQGGTLTPSASLLDIAHLHKVPVEQIKTAFIAGTKKETEPNSLKRSFIIKQNLIANPGFYDEKSAIKIDTAKLDKLITDTLPLIESGKLTFEKAIENLKQDKSGWESLRDSRMQALNNPDSKLSDYGKQEARKDVDNYQKLVNEHEYTINKLNELSNTAGEALKNKPTFLTAEETRAMLQKIKNFIALLQDKQLLHPDEQRYYNAVYNIFKSEAYQLDNRKLDAFAKQFNLADKAGNVNKGLIKELTELAICNYARELAHEPGTPQQRYESIVKFYEQQPLMSHRTSQSIIFQQYSTPVPVCYLAGVFCGVDKPAETESRIFYHGTSPENAKKIIDKGFTADWDFYATTNPYESIGFGCDKNSSSATLLKIIAKPEAKLLDLTNPFFAEKLGFLKREHNSYNLRQSDIDDYARANNYDAFIYPESLSGGGTTVDYATKEAWIQILHSDKFIVSIAAENVPCFDFKKHNTIGKSYSNSYRDKIESLFKKNNISLIKDFPEREEAQKLMDKFNEELEDSGFDHDKITEKKYGFISTFDAAQQILRKQIYENIEKYYSKDVEPGAVKLFFEPSAGNGNMTIAGKPENFIVNEIDKIRNRNLQTVGYKEVLSLDASEPFKQFEKKFDAMLTNPPFGTMDTNINFNGMPIKKLEHAMAIYGLQTMKDNGKAAIIIGGHTSYDEQGRIQKGQNRDFFAYLYRYYYVQDVINIAGNIYSRQGTTFGIRLILISGRKEKPEGFPPLINKSLENTETGSMKVVNNFQELFERVKLSI